MIMRKVILFALILAIALGGIIFAHAAVTANQDKLLIYPKAEIGDPGVLDGVSAEMTFNCGKHLLWNSSHTFGGETDTEFVYDAKGVSVDVRQTNNHLDFWLCSGTSSYTTDFFAVGSTSYGALFRAVADGTPNGGSQHMALRMADYVDYYALDFELYYREYNRQCSSSVSFVDILAGPDWYHDSGIYNSFLNHFRFPVQEDQMVSITITKDQLGRINSFELSQKGGPELSFISHVDSEGIWFIPIFRDEQGAPLPYESPEGHGIYFIPWMVNYTYDTEIWVAPDFSKLQRVIALDEGLLIDHIRIDIEKNECRMLSREGGSYVLTVWNLSDGTPKSRLEVLPHDASRSSFGTFAEDAGFLLVTAQGQLALVDPDRNEILLTAPDVEDQRYRAYLHDAVTGDLRFENGRLYLLDAANSYHDGAFWTAVWQEGELLYYGEYDCALMRGNDHWYYNSVTADLEPLQWK